MIDVIDNIVSRLSSAQKRALFKLAVDIVKADKCIHSSEVSFLGRLQAMCGVSGEELELIHYLSLQQAINSLKGLDERQRKGIVDVLESIVGVDNDVDEREKKLLAAVKLSLGSESSEWSAVVSAAGSEAECTTSQIVYLEKAYCGEAHRVLDDRYDNLLITKALNDAGLHLFYLPAVVAELGKHWNGTDSVDTKFALLCRSMEFIVPSGDKAKLQGLGALLENLSTDTFCKVVCSRCNIDIVSLPFEAFMMIKIQDGYMLDDDGSMVRSNDFLCIDISHNLKHRILHFVGMLESPLCLLPYEGYYRILYDYLSSESEIISDVVIDDRYDFRLKELGNEKLVFESAPQAKTLYLLLLRYGRQGVSQECFEQALAYLESDEVGELMPSGKFDIIQCKAFLAAKNADWALLISNLMTIYESLSTKDSASVGFVGYIANIIRHRSSIKNYINKAFMSVRHLAGKENYCIVFDQADRKYRLPIDAAFFYVQRAGIIENITVSDTWKKLSI